MNCFRVEIALETRLLSIHAFKVLLAGAKISPPEILHLPARSPFRIRVP
jgi:hypothetical protein